MKSFSLYFYYLILNKLPHSSVLVIGLPCERFREFFVRRIFKSCGTNVNVGKGARFGNGKFIEIGDNSCIGMFSKGPNNILIGREVMMGVDFTIFSANHIFDRI